MRKCFQKMTEHTSENLEKLRSPARRWKATPSCELWANPSTTTIMRGGICLTSHNNGRTHRGRESGVFYKWQWVKCWDTFPRMKARKMLHFWFWVSAHNSTMKCFGFYTKMSRDNAASGLWCCVQSLFFMEDIWTRQRRKVYITKLTLGHFHSAFLRFLTKQPFTTTIRQSVSCEGWKQPLKNEQERTICVKTGTCTLNKNYKRAKKKKTLSGILGPSAL